MSRIIRASSSNEYSTCPRRWAARALAAEIAMAGNYQLRETPQSVGASVGTGTHAAITHALQVQIDTGVLGNATEAEQKGLEAFAQDIEARGVTFDDLTSTKSQGEVQIVRQAKAYRAKIAPVVKPKLVERRLEADFGNVIVSGQADILEHEFKMDDIKTGRMVSPHPPQYGLYVMLHEAHTGDKIVEFDEQFVPRCPVRAEQAPPQVIAYDVETCKLEAKAVMRHIVKDLEEWDRTGDAGTFISNPSSHLCSDKWCPAWGTNFCNAWRYKK